MNLEQETREVVTGMTEIWKEKHLREDSSPQSGLPPKTVGCGSVSS